MKTAVEEIREAMQRAYSVSTWHSDCDRLKLALARLDELEKQIAEAEERGRKAGYRQCEADAIAHMPSLASSIGWARAKFVQDELAGGQHVGAADRAKGSAGSSAPIPHDHNAEVAAAGTCAACAAERAKGGDHG